MRVPLTSHEVSSFPMLWWKAVLPGYLTAFLGHKRHEEASFAYPIEDEIVSYATRVIFTRHPHSGVQLCLKLWLPCTNGVYNIRDPRAGTPYFLEGLYFNSRFAPDVYLGLAPIQKQDQDYIQLGPIIAKPDLSEIQPESEYVLVMKRLDEQWRLDVLLSEGAWNISQNFQVLHLIFANIRACAKKVAEMQRDLKPSPESAGTYQQIRAKLDLNIQFFDEALVGYTDNTDYWQISAIMREACTHLADTFEARRKKKHIKRCHGDLRATNLWIRPSGDLVALDCIDFMPELCHIDTLSDVAMLATDIELYTQQPSWQARYFLYNYLKAAGEHEPEVSSLLAYYMTEKCMVSAYVAYVYHHDRRTSRQYIDLALKHALVLKGYCQAEKLAVMVSETIQDA